MIYEYDCEVCNSEDIEIECAEADRKDQLCPHCESPLGTNNISSSIHIGRGGLGNVEHLGTRSDGSPVISMNGPPPSGVDFDPETFTSR